MGGLRYSAAVVAAVLVATLSSVSAQEDWRQQVEAQRRQRDTYLRSDPFSPLALVHRAYLEGRKKLTIGSGADADLRLTSGDIATLHAVLEVQEQIPVFRSVGGARVVGPGWSESSAPPRPPMHALIGQYYLLYRAEAPVRGAAVEVYDTEEPALKEFCGLEYFPVDAKFRVEAEVWPNSVPGKVQLVDSAGQPRPYYVWGEMRFELNGKTVMMELYTTTLDGSAIERNGFMLIFADATSGKESYYAGRYLDIEGKLSGAVTVDFNLARNPPCAFSPVFTCPFPRAQNRLPVAIRAGEKAYTGKTATPMQP